MNVVATNGDFETAALDGVVGDDVAVFDDVVIALIVDVDAADEAPNENFVVFGVIGASTRFPVVSLLLNVVENLLSPIVDVDMLVGVDVLNVNIDCVVGLCINVVIGLNVVVVVVALCDANIDDCGTFALIGAFDVVGFVNGAVENLIATSLSIGN